MKDELKIENPLDKSEIKYIVGDVIVAKRIGRDQIVFYDKKSFYEHFPETASTLWVGTPASDIRGI